MRLEGDPSEPVLPRLRGNGFWGGTPEASSVSAQDAALSIMF